MGAKTDISWCDSTVNCTTGCPGCELWKKGVGGTCYAGTLHETRLAKSLPNLYAPSFTEVRLAPGRMRKAAAWPDLAGKDRPGKPWLNGRRRLIFISDMGDALSADVSFQYLRDEVISAVVTERGLRHDWIWLTKRPKRMAEFSRWLADDWCDWPENLWAGTSVTSDKTLGRIDDLLNVGNEDTTRVLSIEPMLGPIDLSPWLFCKQCNGPSACGRGAYETPLENACGGPWFRECRCSRINQVVVGGESGPHARRFDLMWARSIRDQCQAAGTAYFFKQMGRRPYVGDGRGVYDDHTYYKSRDSHGADPSEWPSDLKIQQFPTQGHVDA